MNIIIEEIVFNPLINIEETVTNVVIEVSEMQMPKSRESLGLENVDNTRDVDKPVSNDTLLALQAKIDLLVFNQNISLKVDKVIGKSLILDSEITRLGNLANYDGSGKEDTANKSQNIEADKLSTTKYGSVNAFYNWALGLFVKGRGTSNYLPKFTAEGSLGNSQIVDNGTNVGIGTTTPTAKLTILGNNTILFTGASAQNQTSSIGTDSNDNLTISAGLGSGKLITLGVPARNITLNGSGNIYKNDVHTFNTAGDINLFKILQNGNVGIGTTSPKEKLHAAGNGKFTGSVQVGDNVAIASISNVGAIRYRSDANNSYADMCMLTGVEVYGWVNIITNTF